MTTVAAAMALGEPLLTAPRHTYGPGDSETPRRGQTQTDRDARRAREERRAKAKAAKKARKLARRRTR